MESQIDRQCVCVLHPIFTEVQVIHQLTGDGWLPTSCDNLLLFLLSLPPLPIISLYHLSQFKVICFLIPLSFFSLFPPSFIAFHHYSPFLHSSFFFHPFLLPYFFSFSVSPLLYFLHCFSNFFYFLIFIISPSYAILSFLFMTYYISLSCIFLSLSNNFSTLLVPFYSRHLFVGLFVFFHFLSILGKLSIIFLHYFNISSTHFHVTV